MQFRTLVASALAILAMAASLFAPAFVSADTLAPTVSVQQLMQGAPTCGAPQVLSVTPYVYGGSLNSFDVTISDPSYVVVGGSAGATPIPLTLVSRWMGQGSVRMHVDVDSLPVYGTMPLSLTMLAAQPGRGICAATVTFSITGPAAPVSAPTTSTQYPAQTQEGSGVQSAAQGETQVASTSGATSTPVVSGSVIATPFSNLAASVTSLCSTSQGPSQLWLVLLAVYFALVLTAVLANIQALRSSQVTAYSLVLVPLFVLAAFWLLLPSCRAVPWIGLAAIIIAIGGIMGLAQQGQGVITDSVPMLPPAATAVTANTAVEATKTSPGKK